MDNQRWFITMLIWDIREFKILSKLCYADQGVGLGGIWYLVCYEVMKLWWWLWLFVLPLLPLPLPLITLGHTPDYFIISHPVLQMFTTPHLHDNNMTLWYLNFIIMVFKLWPLWSRSQQSVLSACRLKTIWKMTLIQFSCILPDFICLFPEKLEFLLSNFTADYL